MTLRTAFSRTYKIFACQFVYVRSSFRRESHNTDVLYRLHQIIVKTLSSPSILVTSTLLYLLIFFTVPGTQRTSGNPVLSAVVSRCKFSPIPVVLGSVRQCRCGIRHRIKLLGVSPMGSLYTTIEFRGMGWQHKKPYASSLAFLFENNLKLRVTTYLNCF